MIDNRRKGTTPLRGRPLDEDGAIEFEIPARIPTGLGGESVDNDTARTSPPLLPREISDRILQAIESWRSGNVDASTALSAIQDILSPRRDKEPK